MGTLVESTREPGLLDRAYRLLGELGWHGPAQVEFKVDPESGRTWLIEINGRFWGTLAAAVAAGIDFPQVACRLALGEDVPPAFDYAVGQRYRFPFPFGLLALGEGGCRWRTVRDFFVPGRGVCSDVEWRDPLPHLAEAVYVARRAWERRRLPPGRGRPRLSGPPDPA